MKHYQVLFLASILGFSSVSFSDEPTQKPIAIAQTIIVANEKSFCPDDMVYVEGDYCPVVEEVCLEWVDAKGVASKEAIPADGESGRCGTWKYPTSCLSDHKVHMRYCIDRYEFPNVKGQRPKSWMSWIDAKNEIEAIGKRLCTEREWIFSEEGSNMKPYPYGDGYHRDRTACNIDNPVPKGLDVFKAHSPNDETAKILDSMLVPSGSMERCVSDFGVHDGVGNIDEWVLNESGHPYISSLVSGHVFGVRNKSRGITKGHGPTFYWYETGTRGCKNAN